MDTTKVLDELAEYITELEAKAAQADEMRALLEIAADKFAKLGLLTPTPQAKLRWIETGEGLS